MSLCRSKPEEKLALVVSTAAVGTDQQSWGTSSRKGGGGGGTGKSVAPTDWRQLWMSAISSGGLPKEGFAHSLACLRLRLANLPAVSL